MNKTVYITFAVVLALLCLGFVRSTIVATSANNSASISVQDLHLQTDVRKLPTHDIPDLF